MIGKPNAPLPRMWGPASVDVLPSRKGRFDERETPPVPRERLAADRRLRTPHRAGRPFATSSSRTLWCYDRQRVPGETLRQGARAEEV